MSICTELGLYIYDYMYVQLIPTSGYFLTDNDVTTTNSLPLLLDSTFIARIICTPMSSLTSYGQCMARVENHYKAQRHQY